MISKQLFHSQTDPVPELRRDIQIIPFEDDGKKLLFFHDIMGYLTENFALDSDVQPLLQMFNGNFSINRIHKQMNGNIHVEDLLNFVQLLDHHRVLYSDYFRSFSNKLEQNFENSNTRRAAFAGDSYPENREELNSFFAQILGSPKTNSKKIHALFAPHIEISIGEKQYGEAFSRLKHMRPKRLIILATSHYSDYYYRFYNGFPFIGSRKTFNIPGRDFSPDLDLINILYKDSPANGFTLKDRAHRIEHSVEFHLSFASVIWQHELKIVPILVTGFDEMYYHEKGDLSKKIDRFTTQLKSLIDEETFVLISGDLSHVGQKFGDSEPAGLLRKKVEKSDKQFLEISKTGNPDRLLHHTKKDYNATRICGFSPLYTYLKMFPGQKGEILNYFWWDEKERNSAVSFGSILY